MFLYGKIGIVQLALIYVIILGSSYGFIADIVPAEIYTYNQIILAVFST